MQTSTIITVSLIEKTDSEVPPWVTTTISFSFVSLLDIRNLTQKKCSEAERTMSSPVGKYIYIYI